MWVLGLLGVFLQKLQWPTRMLILAALRSGTPAEYNLYRVRPETEMFLGNLGCSLHDILGHTKFWSLLRISVEPCHKESLFAR